MSRGNIGGSAGRGRSSRQARRNKAFQSKQGGPHSAHTNTSCIGDGKCRVPFRADDSVEIPVTSSSGALKSSMAWGEGSVSAAAGGGWRTRCPPWCSKRRTAELAGAGPRHPRAVGHAWCQEGQRERLSRAQMLTFGFPSRAKGKDPCDFPGLGAELSIGKSKSQDQFLTCMPNLLLSSSLWHRLRNSMEMPLFYQQNPEQRQQDMSFGEVITQPWLGGGPPQSL